MGGADLKIQMLKLYLVEQKKCLMWYVILSIAIHNYVVIHKSVSHIKATDCLTFWLQPIKGVIEEQGLTVPHLVYSCLSIEPLPKTRNVILWREFTLLGKRQNQRR
jgi:hypothetical protein